MYTVCYTHTGTNVRTFEETDNFEVFISNLPPHMRVDHVFATKNDVKDVYNDYERHFLSECCYYGYQPSDLHADFIDNEGNRVELLGLNPRNRKYIFILKNYDTGKILKATRNYMRRCTRASMSPANTP